MTKFVDPTDIVGATFWLISIAMAAATVFLLFERRRVADRWKAPVTIAGAVTLVSAIQYFYLRDVWTATGKVSTVYRFIDWQLTVPMQTVIFYLVLAAVAAVSAGVFWRLLVASVVMIGAAYLGAAGYMSPTLGFLIAAAGGLYILGEIYLGEASKVNSASGNAVVQGSFNALRLIATIGWAIYPLGYFMEFLGGGVDPKSINVIYNLADFLNKIAFGLVVYRAAVKDTG
ncbi:MAG: bacteriorhodopsin [Rhodospirillaceae bacterium]|nr:bacteriorhodopsin [Rhodospirillaceae bacterium]MDE0617282.1 bacteriorhodopsin [Rhodospirillaceae bacterium]